VPPVDRRDRRIENPILNRPCDAPTRHFRFDAAGITTEIVESRRPSAYFMPIARPKKKSAQKSLETEWTLDRIKETTEVQRTDEKLKRAPSAARSRRRITGRSPSR